MGDFFVLSDEQVSLSILFLTYFLQVPKKQFKVGSLDQLMELMDTFSKYDAQIDSSCKRNEAVFHQTAKELNK